MVRIEKGRFFPGGKYYTAFTCERDEERDDKINLLKYSKGKSKKFNHFIDVFRREMNVIKVSL